MRDWLVDLRRKKGLIQEAVAREAGISRAYFAQIESGVRCPSPKAAKRIGQFLDFPWTRFFEDTGGEA